MHVVRYYARIGLLEAARDSGNGYKLFTDSDVPRLLFIRKAQMLGYTLSEIARIFEEAAQGDSPCPVEQTSGWYAKRSLGVSPDRVS